MTKNIRSLDDLTPDQRNANAGTERGVYMVETSLEKLGAGRSVVVDREGNIIAGNKTVMAAIQKGFPVEVIKTTGDKLVIVQREDLDLNDGTGKARQLAYADNRASDVGLEWSAEQVLADLRDGIELDDWFKGDEIDALLADIGVSPDFRPVGEDDQPRLDELEPKIVTCPHCGETFDAGRL